MGVMPTDDEVAQAVAEDETHALHPDGQKASQNEDGSVEKGNAARSEDAPMSREEQIAAFQMPGLQDYVFNEVPSRKDDYPALFTGKPLLTRADAIVRHILNEKESSIAQAFLEGSLICEGRDDVEACIADDIALHKAVDEQNEAVRMAVDPDVLPAASEAALHQARVDAAMDDLSVESSPAMLARAEIESHQARVDAAMELEVKSSENAPVSRAPRDAYAIPAINDKRLHESRHHQPSQKKKAPEKPSASNSLRKLAAGTGFSPEDLKELAGLTEVPSAAASGHHVADDEFSKQAALAMGELPDAGRVRS